MRRQFGIFGILTKRLLQAGTVSAISFALGGCGGAASSVPSSNAVYFKTVTLQTSKLNQLTGSQSAFRRRSADACTPAENLTVSGTGDVYNAVVGTLSNGNAVNVDWVDKSTGYANYST